MLTFVVNVSSIVALHHVNSEHTLLYSLVLHSTLITHI